MELEKKDIKKERSKERSFYQLDDKNLICLEAIKWYVDTS